MRIVEAVLSIAIVVIANVLVANAAISAF